ncbi:LOW QUALITY PROTEIN: hypothetical protein TorRG33x02_239320 [Trema orientale]|uniref:Uncharacterized protein n=1 Tax=Trema orientale TaxID=63057 RepID=A0A2P5DXR7_TREOI|nr:LOW QUALITY PROTEIN: hypothetical protein TorRG33x02_239320 [Trema orientale]
MQKPLEVNWKIVKRILRYLSSTLEFGLTKATKLDVIGFCDADWASDPDDRCSTSAYYVYLGPDLISWHSRKQHTVSRSSTEAEYRSLANIVAEITWLQSLLIELEVQQPSVPVIWCDNLGTVLLSANPIQHAQTKHIEMDLYFVREKAMKKEIEVRYIHSQDQVADVLTKAVFSSLFPILRTKLRVEDCSTLSLRGHVRTDNKLGS